jgi:PIN domain nuclease of toxin-antitoxin system
VRVLLDTHAFIWWDNGELDPAAVDYIVAADEVWVSAASGWEIAIKAALGKLHATAAVADAVAEYGFGELPVSLRHTDVVRTLPPHHSDPFDRLLVAQAQHEGLTLVTADRAFERYRVLVHWI